ncbi:Thiol-disulfide oxidoreductase resA [Bacteroidales bacterium Barb7]|nr:Thiol-disulfide oxidoreductase resA [Bacteroidales bacterium Barb7]
MRNKIALLLGGIVYLFASCGRDYMYRIEGELDNLGDSVVYAVFEADDYRLIDTVVCSKPGRFVIEKEEADFNGLTLFFNNRSAEVIVYLPPEGGNISLSGDATYPLLVQVKGGQTNNRLSAVRKRLSPLLKEYTDLINGQNTADVTSRLIHIDLQLTEQVTAYVKEHPDEEASVVLIDMFFTGQDDTRQMDELLALLDPQLKSFHLIRDLEQRSARAKRTAIGAEAPGFTVKNIYGHTISPDSFASKYLLLTFTAPWCDLCHTEDLYLDQIIVTYPKNKLDVLLLSLDSQPAQVREALAKDPVKWNVVADSAGQVTMLLDLYNVRALPLCFLIDEERKILLKTDNGLEVKRTLEKLMGGEDGSE